MIYEFQSYKSLFNSLCDQYGRGATTALAEYLSCKPGFVSQVLKGDSTHFSLEHILKGCQFFRLGEAETKFVLLLGQYEKAGSHDLQRFFHQQIRDIQHSQQQIKSKISPRGPEMTEADMGVYYSHWAYMAVHILVSLKSVNTIPQLSERLGLPLDMISQVCDFLCTRGLIDKNEGRYEIGKTRLHLPANSPLVRSLHQNWRLRAIENLGTSSDKNLHYSSVMTMSVKDAHEVRTLLLELIKQKEKSLKIPLTRQPSC